MDKHRKLGQETIWIEIMSSAKDSGSRLQQRESPTSRNWKKLASTMTPIMKLSQGRYHFAKRLKESEEEDTPLVKGLGVARGNLGAIPGAMGRDNPVINIPVKMIYIGMNNN